MRKTIYIGLNENANITVHKICSVVTSSHISNLVPKDTTTNKTISFRRKQLSGLLLTTLMFLWIPSKLLISLVQSLKLSLRKSSTHRAKASWGLLRTWWRTVTKIFGRAWKRWKRKNMKYYGKMTLSIKYFQGTKMTKERNYNFYHGKQHCCWSRAGKVEC